MLQKGFLDIPPAKMNGSKPNLMKKKRRKETTSERKSSRKFGADRVLGYTIVGDGVWRQERMLTCSS